MFGVLLSLLLTFGPVLRAEKKRDHRVHQYHFGSISIPPASAGEPMAEKLSLPKAVSYLEDGAKAWINDRGCVSCHTTGWYGILRPQLASQLGAPDAALRAFLEHRLDEKLAEDPEEMKRGANPAEIVYLAAALASWDAHVEKSLSPETEKAFDAMFSLQHENGVWYSVDTWPPFESHACQLATVAAMAVGMAPGWLDKSKSAEAVQGVGRLRDYLRRVEPPHDYARAALLWTSQYFSGLMDAAEQDATVQMILNHQRPDGGWSIRSFAEPEQWGRGNRAERLRAEENFGNPASDGHQTGMALVVLTSAGVPASHVAVQRGLQWLRTNQRQSGRWWTKSLNTDKWHFITYTGTLYPVMALAGAEQHLEDGAGLGTWNSERGR